MESYLSDLSFIPVIKEIRERISEFNAQINQNQIEDKPLDVNLKNINMSQFGKVDESKFEIGQASPSEFSFHWETMTVKQKKKALHDFVECEYKELTTVQKDKIKEFLCKDLVRCNLVNTRVQWNGYFVDAVKGLRIKPLKTNKSTDNNLKVESDDKIAESKYLIEDDTPKLPAQLAYENVQVDKKIVEDEITEDDEIMIGFEKIITEKTCHRKAGEKGPTSFHSLRTRVRREKDTFFVNEAKEI